MPCDVILCYDRNTLEPIVIPEDDRFLNMLIMGPTGTGKSSQVILPLIFQDLLNGGCGFTVIDPKEDLAEAVYSVCKNFPDRNVIYMDPALEDCPKYNPFDADLTTVTKNLIKILSPSFLVSTNEEKEALDLSRALITKSLKLLKQFPDIVGQNLNICSYCDFITNKYNMGREKINKTLDNIKINKLDRELTDICEWFAYQYFEPSCDIYQKCAGARIKIEDMANNKYLQRVLMPTPGSDEVRLDFPEHLRNGDIVIINTKNTILGNLGKTFGEFVMLDFLNAVFTRKHYSAKFGETEILPHFLYVDEFATFSPVLTDMFTQGRSFRVGTHIVAQNRALLKMCGEENTAAQSLLIESNARNLVLFPGLNGEDAEYYSKQFYNLRPEEICYRPFGQICYRIVQHKSISKPGVGLVFFIDQTPNTDSVELEKQYEDVSKSIFTSPEDKFD